jgi:hypothetical protein
MELISYFYQLLFTLQIIILLSVKRHILQANQRKESRQIQRNFNYKCANFINIELTIVWQIRGIVNQSVNLFSLSYIFSVRLPPLYPQVFWGTAYYMFPYNLQ